MQETSSYLVDFCFVIVIVTLKRASPTNRTFHSNNIGVSVNSFCGEELISRNCTLKEI